MNSLTIHFGDVLDFWFNEKLSVKEKNRLWFGGGEKVDAVIRSRFGATVVSAAEGRLSDWVNEANSCLALIILLDQFTLNIYRGQALSFELNVKALPMAIDAIRKGFDQRVPRERRTFFYLPLEHAENKEAQSESVSLFRKLRDESPSEERDVFDGYLRYAILHQEVIERFGRFPNRNEVLGRPSTADEDRYLREEGSPF